MKIIKTFLTIIVALATLAGSVFVENSISAKQISEIKNDILVYAAKGDATVTSGSKAVQIENSSVLRVKDLIETSATGNAEIDFSGNGLIRIAPKSKIVLKKVDSAKDSYSFELMEGKAWLNTLYTPVKVNLIAGSAVVMPDRASVNVVYDGTKTDVYVIMNQAGIGLIEASKALDKVYSEHDSSLINYYLVSQWNQSSVFKAKITEEADAVGKLLYSKLIKEFQVGLIDSASLATDGWYLKNVQSDKEKEDSISKKAYETIVSRNLQIQDLNSTGYQFKKFSDQVTGLLTFSGEKLKRKALDNVFAFLYDSEYLYFYGRGTEAKDRMQMFKQALSDVFSGGDEDLSSRVLAKLKESYYDLSFVYPDDKLFDVKLNLRDFLLQYLAAKDLIVKFSLVRDDVNYAYNLANSSQLNAKLSFERYFRNLMALLQANKNKINSMPYLIAEENQLMNNLFRQFSLYYQNSFFDSKYAWETELMAVLPEGSAKSEEKQTVISDKIDFLKQLQGFFLDGQVSIREARAITIRLIGEIKDLLASTGSEAGINDLFAVRLKDYGTFLRFINSSQIVNLNESTMKKGYADFVAQQKEDVSVEEVIQEFSIGGTKPQQVQTVDQIVAQINADFAAQDVSELKLGQISSATQKMVSIDNGYINNISFSGKYNWELKLISEVTVDGKVLAKEPIKISSLKQIVVPEETQEVVVTQETQALTTQETATQEPVKKVPRAETAAKILMVQKLKDAGVIVSANDLAIIDKAKALYSIRNAYLQEDNTLKFGMEFSNTMDMASNIVINTKSGDKLITENILLKDLSKALVKVNADLQNATQQNTEQQASTGSV